MINLAIIGECPCPNCGAILVHGAKYDLCLTCGYCETYP